MSKEMLKSLIDLIDETDTETIFKVLVRFVPSEEPLSDEIEVIMRANKDIEANGIISHDAVNWD